jgi:hypothetical protein
MIWRVVLGSVGHVVACVLRVAKDSENESSGELCKRAIRFVSFQFIVNLCNLQPSIAATGETKGQLRCW